MNQLFLVHLEWWYGLGQCLVYALIIWGLGYAYFSMTGDNNKEEGNNEVQ